MAVSAALRTFGNTVKPVGQSINLSATNELVNSTGSVTKIYDYLVPVGFVVTSLEAIKTIANASANQRARIQVYKVTPGLDADASEVLISEIYAPASTKLGTKLFGTSYAGGSAQDPELQVKPQNTAVDGLTQQRIRVKVSIGAVAAENISLSYFVKLQLASFVTTAYANSASTEVTN